MILPPEQPDALPTQKGKASSREKRQNLKELLQESRSVISPQMSFKMDDWVTSIQADDVDNDSDVEIIAGCRNGFVYTFTKSLALKWEAKVGSGRWVTSLAIIPRSEESSRSDGPRILAGSRDGNIYALDQSGKTLGTFYQVGHAIHQLFIHPDAPGEVIVGSDDRCIHLIRSDNGKCIWRYDIPGRARCVCAADVDGDGQLEVLAATTKKQVHVLSHEGKLKGSFSTSYKSFVLAAMTSQESSSEIQQSLQDRENPGPKNDRTVIFSSDMGKDLCGWSVDSQSEHTGLTFSKTWPAEAQKPVLFERRPQIVSIADINRDGKPEILIGSGDRELSIYDWRGQILWKQRFEHNIHSIFSSDCDYDGIQEVIVGMGDNSVHVWKVELDPDLYQKIQKSNWKRFLKEYDEFTELAASLGLTSDNEQQAYRKRELELARYQKGLGQNEEALCSLLRLREQRFQYYWEKPLAGLGHIRDFGFGDVEGNPIDEILVGNDEQEIIALSIEKEVKPEIWRKNVGSSIVVLQTGNPTSEGFESTLTVLENKSAYVIDNNGKVHLSFDGILCPEDRPTCLHVSTTDSQKMGIHKILQIILGLENNKIYVYDNRFQRQNTIHTRQSVVVIYACDMTDDGRNKIIAGTANNSVFVYAQKEPGSTSYEELWHYEVGERVRSMCAADIDLDGHSEVIVGSEDRYLYVLDDQGHLKWRFLLPDSVRSVDACNIYQNPGGESEVLAGGADGYVYIFNCRGDLLQKIPAPDNDRVQVVRAKDLHPVPYSDGMIEIAIASQDHLMLLQVLRLEELDELIQECWRRVRDFFDSLKTAREYVRNPHTNEYLRAYAITRLSGDGKHTQEDFELLYHVAAERNLAPVVARALVRSVINLRHEITKDHNSLLQTRQLLQRLAQRPDSNLRIEIVRMLSQLAHTDPETSFDYLKRFLNNEDLWLRRMVVRQLSYLASSHPTRVFPLLHIGVADKHLWIRQETGRSLAHYFDHHAQQHSTTLLSDIHTLLDSGVDIETIKQISVSAQQLIIQQFFNAWGIFLNDLGLGPERKSVEQNLLLNNSRDKKEFADRRKKAGDALQSLLKAIQNIPPEISLVKETLCFYQDLYNLLRVRDASTIEQFQRQAVGDHLQQVRRISDTHTLFIQLQAVVEALKLLPKRETFNDRATVLIQATSTLNDIKNAHMTLVLFTRRDIADSVQPEDILLGIALQHWYNLLMNQLHLLHGEAKLKIDLTSNHQQHEDHVAISFQVTNEGNCAADQVRVTLEEGIDFEIIGPKERQLETISSLRPGPVYFTIKPNAADRIRIQTSITYSDVSKPNRTFKSSHLLELNRFVREFKEIPTPYHSGTPTSDEKMFYGRDEDRKLLAQLLSSSVTNANRVVMLIGQRRSGKTSLMLQLGRRLTPHIPVFLDVQSLSLSKDTDSLLMHMAIKIHDTLEERSVDLPRIDEQGFVEDSRNALDCYLELIMQKLDGVRLILLIDEFENFDQMIRQKKLNPNFLEYLRSLMQHRLGMNFLLAGTPHLLENTRSSRSVLFNLAQTHKLSRLQREEAESLIVEPVRKYLIYDALALERIHNLTGDQPYLIHLFSEILILHCNQNRKGYVTSNDVNAVLETVLERNQNNFGWVWDLAATPNARLLLSFMAQDANGEERGSNFSLSDLKKMFLGRDIPFKNDQIQKALKHLIREEIVEELNDGRLYTIPVGLTRAWLRENRPPEYVIPEEALKMASDD